MNLKERILDRKKTLLPFLSFIWVSGADGFVDQKEVESFRDVLGKGWNSKVFNELAISNLENFDELTKNYYQGDIVRSLDSISESLKVIQGNFIDNYSEFRSLAEDVISLSNYIAQSSGGFLGFFSVSKEEKRSIFQLERMVNNNFLA